MTDYIDTIFEVAYPEWHEGSDGYWTREWNIVLAVPTALPIVDLSDGEIEASTTLDASGRTLTVTTRTKGNVSSDENFILAAWRMLERIDTEVGRIRTIQRQPRWWWQPFRTATAEAPPPAVRWVKYGYPEKLTWYFMEADATDLVLRQIELRGSDQIPVAATSLDDDSNDFGFITDQPLNDSEDDGAPVIDLTREEFELVWTDARAHIERHGIPKPTISAELRRVVQLLATEPATLEAYVRTVGSSGMSALVDGMNDALSTSTMELPLRVRVLRLNQQLTDMRGRDELWTVSALNRPEWTKVRDLAAAVLASVAGDSNE